MRVEEFSIFVKAVQAYYTKESLFQDAEVITLWYQMLRDIEYPILMTALSEWVVKNRFSPTIADMRKGSDRVRRQMLVLKMDPSIGQKSLSELCNLCLERNQKLSRVTLMVPAANKKEDRVCLTD